MSPPVFHSRCYAVPAEQTRGFYEGKAGLTGAAVRLSGRLICKTLQQASLVARCLPEHKRLTLEEPGCVSFEVAQTPDPLIWQVEEAFTDRAAYEFHQQRARASAWWTHTADIARDYTVFGSD